ncbi:MAG: riboflavin kinase/FMN adenylyltransferase [Flavobacteriaceae bacterium]|jgi:riboflavin kinase/FMN adenylyltransferase
MDVYKSLASYKKKNPSVVTIGTFDGVHLGHKAILTQLVNAAKDENLESILLTFFPHPRMVLQKDSSVRLINTIKERSEIIEQTGVSNLIIHPFTIEFSRLTALEFVRDILVNQLHIKKIIIGYDHQFGRNRTATIKDLREFGETYDFEVVEITAQQLQNVSISSTKIRKALEEGDVQTANQYLGYPFMLSGKIVKGKGIGKTLTFPTANLKIKEDYKLIPKNGVYLVKSIISDKEVFGLTNIGTNPTVGGIHKTIETYFLDYKNDLYDQDIQLNFIKRIREEKTFDSKEALKTAIKEDELLARDYLKINE